MPPIRPQYPYPRQGQIIPFPKPNDKIYFFNDEMIENVINSIITREERNEIQKAIFLPLKELVKPGAKKNKNNKPPRSQNIFLLFRKDKQALLTSKGSTFTSQLKSVSTFASNLWKKASTKEKSVYDRIAFITKKVHKQLWPDYSYKPSRQKLCCSPLLPPSYLPKLPPPKSYLLPPPTQKPYLPPPISQPYLPPLPQKPYLPPLLPQRPYLPPLLPSKPHLPLPLLPPPLSSSHITSYLPSPTLPYYQLPPIRQSG
jgi:hypothetical protein